MLDKTLQPIRGKYGLLEAEIRAVFPPARLLVPDDLRGGEKDLPAAIKARGWPTLGRLRGRVIFSMLDSGEHRAAYVGAATALAGKLMFVNASRASDPYAAMFKVNNAQKEAQRVRDLVLAGFIVTSNVDGADNSDATNTAKLAASLAAGFHYGSTDFPAAVQGRAYRFDMPGGAVARCNPVYPAQGCMPREIEVKIIKEIRATARR